MTTKKNEKIVGSSPIRRVYAEELRQMWEAGKLASDVVDFFQKDKLLERMLTIEASENAEKNAKVGAK